MSSQAKPAGLGKEAIVSMMLLTIQFGFQPLLTAKFIAQNVCRSSIIITTESLKFCLAMFMLITSPAIAQEKGTTISAFQNATKGWSVTSWIKIAFLPAFLYTIQNTLALLAYQNLDGVTFSVLNQTKTISAAVCCFLLMGRKQSKMQVLALILLLVAALIMEHILNLDMLTSSSPTSFTMEGKHFTHGVAPVMGASFLSGLAGAISQMNLQSTKGSSGGGRNPYLFSAELCIASLLILVFSLFFREDGVRIRENGFFDQWTVWTMVPIFTNAMGGIVVGLVTKYAGSVRKGFALIFGMFLSGLVQSSITKEQGVGAVIAALSLYIHATHPYVEKKKKD